MKKTLRIALVSCVSKKLAAPAKAAELYTSDLFRKSRTYAERNADRWLILSAAHGVVAPTTELAPYDVTLSKMNAAEVRAWGLRVARQLEVEVARMAEAAGVELRDVKLVILAGERYCSFRTAFEVRCPAVNVSAPLAGLAIGERLSFLKKANEAAAENPVAAAREATTAARDAFDAACYRRATLHLASGYGVDRGADKRNAAEAVAAIEEARLAFRAAHAAYATELRRSMGLEPVGVEVKRVELEATAAADALPVPVAPITPEIERAAHDSAAADFVEVCKLSEGGIEAEHLHLTGKPDPIGSRGALLNAVWLRLTRRAALAVVSVGPRERLARIQLELGHAYERKQLAIDAGACGSIAFAEVERLEADAARESALLLAPHPRLAARLAVARSRYSEPSSDSIARSERALGA